MNTSIKHILIVGGGISGLITGIQLSRAGLQVTLIEKKSYPMHRVCGEYVSCEVIPFLSSLGLYPESFSPPRMSRFQLTSVNGRSAEIPLGLGGFGISRYAFDFFLYQKAVESGVTCLVNTEVSKVEYSDNLFYVSIPNRTICADLVVGSFGKRSRLDIQMKRPFIKKTSPYVGVKYHIESDHPSNLISLHNFKDGYCGISNVEGGKSNLCYLTHRDNLKAHGNIEQMERAILFRNPFLKSIFTKAKFLFDRPETINEISFETKGAVENHVLMAGDAAGMIAPLCGNGMAMAIRSSKMLAGIIIRSAKAANFNRSALEQEYQIRWQAEFSSRLFTGRYIQNWFGKEWTSNAVVSLMSHLPRAAHFLIEKTHGPIF